MNKSITKSLTEAYALVQEKKKFNFDKKDDDKAPVTDKEDDGEGMDPVDKKAVKKDFKNRDDKDLDNDGDTDSTDKYLHKKRKAITKKIDGKGKDTETEVDEAKGKPPSIKPLTPEVKSMMDKKRPKPKVTFARESVVNEAAISSNTAMHIFSKAERPAHAALMKKKHGVKTTFHGDDELKYHGTKPQVKKALSTHYAGDVAHAKDEHGHIYESTVQKWSVYRRILEKMGDKDRADHYKSSAKNDDIDDKESKGAKDFVAMHHDGQPPEDAVDINKVIDQNKKDMLKGMPPKGKK